MNQFKYSEETITQKKDTEETLTDLNLVILQRKGSGFKVLRFFHRFFGCQGKAHLKADKVYLFGKDHDNKDGE